MYNFFIVILVSYVKHCVLFMKTVRLLFRFYKLVIFFLIDKKEKPPVLRNEYHKENDLENEITYGIVETNELLNDDEKPNLESGTVQYSCL